MSSNSTFILLRRNQPRKQNWQKAAGGRKSVLRLFFISTGRSETDLVLNNGRWELHEPIKEERADIPLREKYAPTNPTEEIKEGTVPGFRNLKRDGPALLPHKQDHRQISRPRLAALRRIPAWWLRWYIRRLQARLPGRGHPRTRRQSLPDSGCGLRGLGGPVDGCCAISAAPVRMDNPTCAPAPGREAPLDYSRACAHAVDALARARPRAFAEAARRHRREPCPPP